MEVRKKVLNRIKPKTLNGKNITGKILIDLCRTYVEAINKGAVPNIQNAWNNICKDQSMAAMNKTMDEFQ
jgi:hypothetical protein